MAVQNNSPKLSASYFECGAGDQLSHLSGPSPAHRSQMYLSFSRSMVLFDGSHIKTSSLSIWCAAWDPGGETELFFVKPVYKISQHWRGSGQICSFPNFKTKYGTWNTGRAPFWMFMSQDAWNLSPKKIGGGIGNMKCPVKWRIFFFFLSA